MQKRLTILILFLLLLAGCKKAQQNSVRVAYVPDEQLGELFHTVQMARIFQDSKTFADCAPRFAPEEIVMAFREKRDQTGFNLKDFVYSHFTVPEPMTVPPTSPENKSMSEHIRTNWSRLIRPPDSLSDRSSLLPLPYAYVVPGGRFREIYYWDTYFTCLGLAASGRWDLVGNMIRNFAHLIDQYGFIPNGNRTYYLTRSQPPFFSHMVMLLGQFKGMDSAAVYLPQLEKEYAFWMEGKSRLNDENPAYRRVVRVGPSLYLNRYWDEGEKPRPESYREDFELAQSLPEEEKKKLYRNIRAACESGWDFSSRWFADGKNLSSIITTEITPVDLNSLLFHLEQTLSALHTHLGNANRAEAFQKLSHKRREAINMLCWDAALGFYTDYHFTAKKPTGRLSMAAVYPLWMGLCDSAQGVKVAERLRKDLFSEGGMATTTAGTGQQWDYPNGWPPLQWIAVQGLRRYNQPALANQLRDRWLKLNERVYKRTGRMVEKYNVADMSLEAGGGEYPVQDGFGWTSGVALSLLEEAGARAAQ
jgi:alpha,alpha-trehalase